MSQLEQGISVQGALRKTFYLNNRARSVAAPGVFSLGALLTYGTGLLELK